MKFGPVPVEAAAGAILAHSLRLPDGVLKKGRVLTPEDVARLQGAGLHEVIVARLEPDDAPEDDAAARIAAALAPGAEAQGLTLSASATGRVNLFAAELGVLRVDEKLIAAVNAVDEAITIATAPALERLRRGQMAATVKIIPYAAPEAAVAKAVEILSTGPALRIEPVTRRSASLVLTLTPGMKSSVARKGAEAVKARLSALGVELTHLAEVPHETAALAVALDEAASQADLALVLTASATSDRLDVCPAAILQAGGRVTRFGMPVDPGNLLVLGELLDRPVIGLPGCARSPKLNGADWVLERLVCGVDVTGSDIAAMGVGGLLKEIPARPSPRVGGADEALAPAFPFVSAIVLGAGVSARMGAEDKLLQKVDGVAQMRRAVDAAVASASREAVVVLGAVDDDRTPLRLAALEGGAARVVHNPESAEGMASSLRAGLAAISPKADAVVVIPADMPLLGAAHIDAVIAAFAPESGRAICRAMDEAGRPGHPVLFGRRFFEALSRLEGDQGARAVIAEHPDFATAVPTAGQGATIDLDTPEDWRAFLAARGADD